MSDNWIVQNLNSALQTWSDKLAEIWTLLTQSPENFKGGAIWSVMTNINGGLKAIGYGLLVLFFAAGLVKTCGSFTDMKKPEHVVKAFIRFALAQGAVMSGMELLTAIFSVVQGIVTNIMSHSGMAGGTVTELPSEIVDKIEAVGMLESIPLWIVTLLGSLLITVLSFVMILTVYGRMFKLYMYTAIAPIPLATFAGEPTQSVGKNFIRFALAQGAVMSGMELLTAIFSIVQGIVTNIMSHSGMAGGTVTELPSEIVDKIEAVGMLESIPLWIVTLLGSLLITVLSFVMILTVYGRMFKLYMYTAIAPIPLATFAGEPTQSVGKNFIRSYAGVCLEGAIIALACIIFSVFASSPPAIGDTSLSAVTIVWNYVGELVFNLLVLVGAVKASDRIVKEIMGL